MEPLRPGVDAFVLALARERLKPDDFTTTQKEGCRLSKDARAVFYASWEDFKANWPLDCGCPREDGMDAVPRPSPLPRGIWSTGLSEPGG